MAQASAWRSPPQAPQGGGGFWGGGGGGGRECGGGGFWGGGGGREYTPVGGGGGYADEWRHSSDFGPNGAAGAPPLPGPPSAPPPYGGGALGCGGGYGINQASSGHGGCQASGGHRGDRAPERNRGGQASVGYSGGGCAGYGSDSATTGYKSDRGGDRGRGSGGHGGDRATGGYADDRSSGGRGGRGDGGAGWHGGAGDDRAAGRDSGSFGGSGGHTERTAAGRSEWSGVGTGARGGGDVCGSSSHGRDDGYRGRDDGGQRGRNDAFRDREGGQRGRDDGYRGRGGGGDARGVDTTAQALPGAPPGQPPPGYQRLPIGAAPSGAPPPPPLHSASAGQGFGVSSAGLGAHEPSRSRRRDSRSRDARGGARRGPSPPQDSRQLPPPPPERGDSRGGRDSGASVWGAPPPRPAAAADRGRFSGGDSHGRGGDDRRYDERRRQDEDRDRRRREEEEERQKHRRAVEEKASEERRKREIREERERGERVERERLERERQERDQHVREDGRIMLEIHKALSKVSHAPQESLENATEELAKTLEKELHKLSTPQKRSEVQQQARLALEGAQKRAAMQEAKNRTEADMIKHLEADKKDVERWVAELTDMVDVAEAKADLFREAVGGVKRLRDQLSGASCAGSTGKDASDLESLLASVDEAREDAEKEHTLCTERATTGKGLPRQVDGIEGFRTFEKVIPGVTAQVKALLARVQKSFASCQAPLHEAASAAAEAREAGVRRTAAAEAQRRDAEVLDRYGVADGRTWTREQVLRYARDTCGSELTECELDRLFELLTPTGASELQVDRLSLLRSAIGAAQQRVRARQQRDAKAKEAERLAVERAERAEALNAAKVHLEEQFNAIEDEIALALKALQVAEEDDKALKVSETSKELESVLHKSEAAFADVQKSVEAMQVRITAFETADIDKALSVWRLAQAKNINVKVASLKARLQRISASIDACREKLSSRSQVEHEHLRGRVVGALRARQREQDLSAENLFTSIVGSEGPLHEAKLASFLVEACKVEIEAASFSQLFVGATDGEESSIDLEGFLSLVGVRHEVKESTVLTEGVSVGERKVLRRLMPGEFFDVYEGPRLEEECRVLRVRGKALKDGMQGWVSVSSNKGTIFVQEVGS